MKRKATSQYGVVFCFATSFWAKNSLCRFWGLSQVVEEEFGLFLIIRGTMVHGTSSAPLNNSPSTNLFFNRGFL
jgi:hypothetical protein